MRFHFRARRHVDGTDNPRALHILHAAKRVFIRDGAATFSGRIVAREAQVSLGSLQHFFPTMAGLLAAMLEFVINEYDEAYEKTFRRLPFNGQARLRAAVSYLIADLWRPDTRKFFFGLWALSCHSRFAARLLNEMYDYHRHNIAAFIGAARPELSEQQCLSVATQVAALIEGSMLFTAPGANRTMSRSAFNQEVTTGILRLVPAPDRAARRGARPPTRPSRRRPPA